MSAWWTTTILRCRLFLIYVSIVALGINLLYLPLRESCHNLYHIFRNIPGAAEIRDQFVAQMTKHCEIRRVFRFNEQTQTMLGVLSLTKILLSPLCLHTIIPPHCAGRSVENWFRFRSGFMYSVDFLVKEWHDIGGRLPLWVLSSALHQSAGICGRVQDTQLCHLTVCPLSKSSDSVLDSSS